MSRILIAGMGNILRGDDGVGVRVAQRLAGSMTLPAGVTVIEVGIGGIHLVQELMAGYDALVIVDAIARGGSPGTIYALEAEPPEIAGWSDERRGDFLADMHYSTPSKALILARALGVLPARAFIVGCEPFAYDDLAIGLSAPVEAAIEAIIERVHRLIDEASRQAGIFAAGG
jgi:hydrogenase maturation protease